MVLRHGGGYSPAPDITPLFAHRNLWRYIESGTGELLVTDVSTWAPSEGGAISGVWLYIRADKEHRCRRCDCTPLHCSTNPNGCSKNFAKEMPCNIIL